MKRCTKCTLVVDEDIAVCPRCKGVEFRAIASDGEADAPSDTAGRGAGNAGELVIDGPPRRSDVIAESRAPTEVGRTGEAGTPATGPEVETQAAPETVKRPVTTVDNAEVIEDEARLREIKAEGLFVIGLLGFATGGKTWFLNRLKHSYHQPRPHSAQSRRPACVPSPPAAPDNSRVGRTNDILMHHFATPTDPRLSFNLLDVAGERFQRAAEKNFVGVADLTLAALGACDAIIIVLPADEVLFSAEIADRDRCSIDRAQRSGRIDPAAAHVGLPPQDELSPTDIETQLTQARAQYDRMRKGPLKERLKAEIKRLETDLAARREWRLAEAANNIEDFANNIGLFAAVLHLQESGMTPQEIGALPTAAAIMTRARESGYRKRAQPVFITLSKMDAVIDPEPWLERKLDRIKVGPAERALLDLDPMALLGERCPGIFHHARAAFGWCKVDAVTAFGGHVGGDVIHYGCDAFGVDSIIEWIHWARQVARGPPWARLEARVAQMLRLARNLAG